MLRLAVLISGGGTNLQNLIDNCADGTLQAEITAVISDRPAYGLERAEKAGITNYLLDRKVLKDNLSKAIMELLENECDYIVLAGYLSILSGEFIERWSGKIINIHPALLPRHGGKGMYGIHVHRSVLNSGDKESGCSVHFVDQGIDSGEVILQRKVPVLEGDTPEILQKRVLEQEYLALTQAIQQLTEKA